MANRTVFVDYLAPDTTIDQIEERFAPIGRVALVTLQRRPNSEEISHAFVQFENDIEAHNAANPDHYQLRSGALYGWRVLLMREYRRRQTQWASMFDKYRAQQRREAKASSKEAQAAAAERKRAFEEKQAAQRAQQMEQRARQTKARSERQLLAEMKHPDEPVAVIGRGTVLRLANLPADESNAALRNQFGPTVAYFDRKPGAATGTLRMLNAEARADAERIATVCGYRVVPMTESEELEYLKRVDQDRQRAREARRKAKQAQTHAVTDATDDNNDAVESTPDTSAAQQRKKQKKKGGKKAQHVVFDESDGDRNEHDASPQTKKRKL